MAVNLVLILDQDFAKIAPPPLYTHSGIRRIEMLNMRPAPSSWLHYTTEGLCLYLAGQQELVSAVIEPRGNEGWHSDGFN
ncbi:hypothetical protein VZT92_014030 [Zoarces viviparus]|uniref:Uncharacterized protein n=1 Tax=Zoarces viviparus TaxID=48416 RepID=A0AAW1EZE7_ZOAVI